MGKIGEAVRYVYAKNTRYDPSLRETDDPVVASRYVIERSVAVVIIIHTLYVHNVHDACTTR